MALSVALPGSGRSVMVPTQALRRCRLVVQLVRTGDRRPRLCNVARHGRISQRAGPRRHAGGFDRHHAGIRTTWIVFRILAAVITVPVAEELAFRGFLIRRFLSSDIDALPPQSFTWLSLGLTSIALGILHGNLWFAGILAGLLYAWALLRRGQLGEAIIAHATTNALLAAYVLLFHKWRLW